MIQSGYQKNLNNYKSTIWKYSKVETDHAQITLQNYIAKNRSFMFANFAGINTNTSLEETSTELKLDKSIHSQPMAANPNETTETDFNSTMLDDGTLFHHIH